MCPGPGQDATGPSQPFHLLPMTCSPYLPPATVIVPMLRVITRFQLPQPFPGGDLASRHKGHLVGH